MTRIAVCAVLSLAAFAPPAVQLAVSTHLDTAPFTVRVHTYVLRNAHNRELCVAWVNESGIGGRGCETLEGAASPVVYWRDILIRDSGTFRVSAVVARDDNQVSLSNVETIQSQ